jgi:hypothetical protein
MANTRDSRSRSGRATDRTADSQSRRADGPRSRHSDDAQSRRADAPRSRHSDDTQNRMPSRRDSRPRSPRAGEGQSRQPNHYQPRHQDCDEGHRHDQQHYRDHDEGQDHRQEQQRHQDRDGGHRHEQERYQDRDEGHRLDEGHRHDQQRYQERHHNRGQPDPRQDIRLTEVGRSRSLHHCDQDRSARYRSPTRRTQNDNMELSTKAKGAPYLPVYHCDHGRRPAQPLHRRLDFDGQFPGPPPFPVHQNGRSVLEPPSPTIDLRRLLEGTPEDELKSIFFGNDGLAAKLQRVAYSCNPGLQPDFSRDHPDFPQERIKCNAEMMKRVLCLCSPSVRKDYAQGSESFVPYIVRTQAKRNMQKLFPHIPLNASAYNFNVFFTWMSKNSPYFYDSEDNLAVMIRNVAASIADPGQTEADTDDAAKETAIINASKLVSLAGASTRGSAVVTFTLDELRNFYPNKLHETNRVRSIDWAMDEKGIDETADSNNTRARYNKYKVALEKLIVQGKGDKGGGKGAKGGKNKKGGGVQADLLTTFKSKCDQLGIQFTETRLGDLAKLFAVIRARMDDLDR